MSSKKDMYPNPHIPKEDWATLQAFAKAKGLRSASASIKWFAQKVRECEELFNK